MTDGYGLSVGDVDGDGIPDVAVPGGGSVRILFGNDPNGLTFADSVEIDVPGVSANELTAALVDIKGDGFADLVVGDELDETDDGRLVVFDSTNAGVNTTPVVDIDGEQNANDRFGSLVAGADVNADGYGDVVVCAHNWDVSSNEGMCALFSGSASGLEIATINDYRWIEEGDHSSEILGNTPGSIAFGDITGDGAMDVIVGSPVWGPSTSNGDGQIRVFDGDPANLKSVSAAQIQGGDVNASLGGRDNVTDTGSPRLATGDVDQDGFDDLIAGMPDYDNGAADNGAVFVWRGSSSSTFNTTVDWDAFGANSDRFGASLAFGHFHGIEKPPSIAIGQPLGNSGEGTVYLFQAAINGLPGTDTPGTATQTVPGDDKGDASEEFGAALAACGNLINSSGDCLAVGAPKKAPGTTGGSVYVFSSSGASGLSVASPVASRSGTDNGHAFDCDEYFGAYVANAGNVQDSDNAGKDDLLVGAPECDDGATDEGAAFLYFAAASGKLTESTWVLQGVTSAALMGVVAGLGDMSGDGIADFGVAAPGSRVVKVFLGVAAATPSTSAVMTYTGATGTLSGASIAGGVDINLDGYMDLLIGEPGYADGHTNEGRYCVLFGDEGGPDNTTDRCGEGGGTNYRVGAAVALGDFNGDGRGDAAVGAPDFASGESGEGRVTVILAEW
jgi:hypothetical protein